ncbi:MAG: SpoVG family protein [Eubacterium sp.]|nr:SpoVG family protein [Eubacterium sp.]
MDAYDNLREQGLDKNFVPVEPPETSVSKIKVSLTKTDNEKSSVKARGQITIDNCFVVKGVSVSEHTNSKTNEKFNSVDMPHFRQTSNGEYPSVVKPITAEARKSLNEAVLNSFNTQTRGAKFADIGGKENTDTYFRQNNQFAEKLMNKLDEKGIAYHARISDTTTISVSKADKAAVEDIKKEIANEGRKPSVLGEVGKIKVEQQAKEAEKPAPQKAKSSEREM